MLLRNGSLWMRLALVCTCAAVLLCVGCDTDDGDDGDDDTMLADTSTGGDTTDPDADTGGGDGGGDTTVTGSCPEEEPFPGGACAAEGRCEYGMECCGATCGPSYVCDCTGGFATSCLNTDIGFGCMEDVVDGDTDSDTTGGSCRSDAECGDTESCVPPGAMVCGTCFQGTPCTEDTTCAAGEVCSDRMARCPCGTESVCVTACASAADCRSGDTCDGDGHCRAVTCTGDADCTTDHFACDTAEGVCRRAACTSDTDCVDGGTCVNGLCHETAGSCLPPVP